MLLHLRRNLSTLLLLFTAVSFTQQSAALPANFELETVVPSVAGGNKGRPVYLQELPDGRMLALRQGGRIVLFDPSSIPAAHTTFLELSDVNFLDERGLMSIALDPDFETNNYFYLFYTHGSSNRFRISRFTSLGNTANPNSETVIWQDSQTVDECCHHGGGLGFGPDGKLYLTTGDMLDSNASQDLTNTQGKVIRINKDGSIPADNPFVGAGGGVKEEIWAYGLRNPYRLYWDLLDDRMYISEVGGNVVETAREDLHVGRAGANYGWPFCEGQCVDPAYDDPIYDYGHSPDPNAAITLGTVYRGNQFPSTYYGTLFLADYARGDIRYLEFNPDGSVATANDFASGLGFVTHLIQGSDGALYFPDYSTLSIKRIRYISGNQPPQITSTTASPSSGGVPLTVSFSATASDAESDPLDYHWVFGDGQEADGQTVSHTYTTTGAYSAHVEVNDGNNTSVSDFIAISVGNPPTVSIDTPADGSTFRAGDTINFSGTASDPDETIPGNNYSWEIVFFHNGHVHPGLNSTGQTGTLTINTAGHDYHENTGYELRLTVTDSDGLSVTDTIRIYPEKVDLTINTSPSGLPVYLDGIQMAAPVVYDTAIDFNHTVAVDDSVCSGDILYQFDSWSDGGSLQHQVTVPAVDTTITAQYTAAGSCSSSTLPSSGLVLHLESDSGVNMAGGIVQSWTDQSGQGNSLSLLSGNPTAGATTPSGAVAIDFDGSADQLSRSGSFSGLPTGNQDRTVFLVANYQSLGYGGFAYGQNKCNKTFGLVVSNAGELMAQGWCTRNDFHSGIPGTGAGWLVQSAVLESSQLSHYSNGTLIDSQSHAFNTVLNTMRLGAEIDGTPAVDMEVAAVLVYNRALSAVEQTEVLNYLNNKYMLGGGGNAAPVAIDDTATTSTGGTVTIPVLANDTDDVGLEISSVEVVSNGTAGTASVNAATGEVIYTHGGSAAGADSFTYRVMDTSGQWSNTATVNINIIASNQPPVANDDNASTLAGNSVVIDVLANDTDDTGLNPASVTVMSDGSLGTTSVNTATGQITYSHSSGAAGTDSFTYQVEDDNGASSNTATVSISITANNQPPVAVNDSAAVVDGGSVVIAVLNNDTDDSALDITTVTVVANASAGVATVNTTTGEVSYAHGGGGAGTDSFTYRVSDDAGAVSNTATVNITISASGGGSGGNLPSSGLVLQLESDVGVSVSGGIVQSWMDQSGLGNDLDLLSGNPTLGAVTPNNEAAIDFDGSADQLARTSGLAGLPAGNSDRSVFLVTNYQGTGYGGFAWGQNKCNKTFGLVVNPQGFLMSQGWCTANDFISTTAGTGAGWIIQSVILDSSQLSHYLDGALIDSQSHTYNTVVNQMRLGAEIDGTPAVDMEVAAVLVYDRALSATEHSAVLDYLQNKYLTGSGGSSNAAPVAVDDSATITNADTTTINILSNDTDDSGLDISSVEIISDGSAGSALVNASTGQVIYTHSGNGAGTDSFTYRVQDDAGVWSNVATVTITITDNNQPPTANNDTASVLDGASVVINVLSNDTDDSSLDPTTVVIMSNGNLGSATVNSTTGVVTYSHNGSGAGSDSFTYRVMDDAGEFSNVATVLIFITTSNQPPTANDDAAVVESGNSVVIDVLSNDSDDNALDPTSVNVVADSSLGSTSVNATTGAITYTHSGGGAGTDSFSYQVNDSDGEVSNTATVSITINAAGGGGANLPTNGLVLQLESDAGVAVTGGTVQSWTDQSGQGNDLTLLSGNPTISALTPNGALAVDFDGTGDQMVRSSGLTGLPSGNGDRSVFLVVNYQGTGYGGFAWGRNRCNKTFGLVVNPQGFLMAQGWCYANDFSSATLGTGAGWLIQSLVLNASQLSHFVDGALIDSQTHTFNTVVNQIRLGAEIDGTPAVDMEVAAVLVYNRALSTSEQSEVMSYLQTKYLQ